jgi:hypothetical protein
MPYFCQADAFDALISNDPKTIFAVSRHDSDSNGVSSDLHLRIPLSFQAWGGCQVYCHCVDRKGNRHEIRGSITAEIL